MINEIRKPDETLAKVLPPVRLLDGVVYVPSQFTLSFAYKGRDFVCNTLTRQCLETKLPGRCRAGEGYDALIRKLFLVPEGKDECGFYNAVVSMLRVFGKKKDSKGYKGYTILPTLACNARCVYCYEEGMKPVTMAPGTVEQTIRYIVDTHTDKSVGLHWFGGEPLMCPDIIGRICEGLRDAGLHYRSSMVSNGSLITPEILAKMTGLWQLDRIQISMDGAESDYILRKRYINYQDHYHRVLEAIRMLSEAGIEVSIRCNVDEDNFDRIPAFLEDLKDGIPFKEKVRCYLSPLYGIRAGERSSGLEKSDCSKTLDRGCRIFYWPALRREAGIQGEPLHGGWQRRGDRAGWKPVCLRALPSGKPLRGYMAGCYGRRCPKGILPGGSYTGKMQDLPFSS